MVKSICTINSIIQPVAKVRFQKRCFWILDFEFSYHVVIIWRWRMSEALSLSKNRHMADSYLSSNISIAWYSIHLFNDLWREKQNKVACIFTVDKWTICAYIQRLLRQAKFAIVLFRIFLKRWQKRTDFSEQKLVTYWLVVGSLWILDRRQFCVIFWSF